MADYETLHVGYHDADNVSNFGGDPIKFNFFLVFLCPPEDMSPYCSAHDEWLIMKLCMYIGYHDANNVSIVGGDPVIQLNKVKKKLFVLVLRHMSPYCSAQTFHVHICNLGTMMPTICQILVVTQ